MDWIKEIKGLAELCEKDLIAYRRHLHANPELSFKEKSTSAFVRDILDRLDIPYESGIGGYGVVGLIKGANSNGKVVALRADMDALPIQEENNCDYVSQVDGVMHACGHDVHTTCVLGAATILNALKAHLEHDIKLVFQPAEEKLPGGASLMIKDGVLKGPDVSTMIGQHVHPEYEVGKIGFRAGPMMASADEIYLTVQGRGGHAALPHNTIDPIVVSAAIINALQSVASRSANPIDSTVLSFGKINSMGGATNVIPSEVKLEGTLRAFDEKWRAVAHERIKSICERTAEAFGASCVVDIRKGYPYLHSDEALTGRCKRLAQDYLGTENVLDLPMRMTAEDFSFYSHALPSCFYRLGVANSVKGITSPVHTATFDVDEDCLAIGAGLMAYLATQKTY